jgi:prepilin-type N-terminal cleavage/methylation domain-containing protein
MPRESRRGYSLVELLAAIALVAIVGVKVFLLMSMRARTEVKQSTELVVEDQARRVMEQIVYSVMGAARERLTPYPESPLFSSQLRYQVALGVENGEVVWDDPQLLGLGAADNELVWRKRPFDPEELRVVWCRNVGPFLEGEIPNGVDDNGNGLTDEKGVTFTVDGNLVTVRLTLQRVDEHEQPFTRTMEMVIACRN